MDHETLMTPDDRIVMARTSLATRVAALEDHVTESVRGVADTVTDATGSVRSLVTHATDSARGLIDHTADHLNGLEIRDHIRAHPWQDTISALAAGFITSFLFGRTASAPATLTTSAAPADPKSQPLRHLAQLAQRELISAGESVIATASQMLKENVQQLTAEITAPSNRFERVRRVLNQSDGRGTAV